MRNENETRSLRGMRGRPDASPISQEPYLRSWCHHLSCHRRANTRLWSNVGLMLSQRRRQWADISLTPLVCWAPSCMSCSGTWLCINLGAQNTLRFVIGWGGAKRPCEAKRPPLLWRHSTWFYSVMYFLNSCCYVFNELLRMSTILNKTLLCILAKYIMQHYS